MVCSQCLLPADRARAVADLFARRHRHLAHGAFYAIGAYLAVSIGDRLGFGGAALVTPVLVGFVGRSRSSGCCSAASTHRSGTVAAADVRLGDGGGAGAAFDLRPPRRCRGRFAGTARPTFIGDFIYSKYRALIILVAAACVAGLWFLLQKTPFGRVVRAGVQNPDMVGALGIVAAALHGRGRVPWRWPGRTCRRDARADFSIHPAMGAEIITSAFVVVVIGGLGSFGA